MSKVFDVEYFLVTENRLSNLYDTVTSRAQARQRANKEGTTVREFNFSTGKVRNFHPKQGNKFNN